jgi:Pyridoxamine 5'-phosphate oxidase
MNGEAHQQKGVPRASRPYMPGYGLLDAQSGAGLLPWSWAEERLVKARSYWVATVRPEGRPHVMPVWGIWLKGAFYFSSGVHSRKVRNLENNPHCTVCTDQPVEPVILEGTASRVSDWHLLQEVASLYNEKYQWNLEVTQGGVQDEGGNGGPVIAVVPRVVFGFYEELSGSATRWSFGTR